MSHKNFRRDGDRVDSRGLGRDQGPHGPGQSCSIEANLHNNAIGRSKWVRLTHRSLRHTARIEVAAEAKDAAPTRPRNGIGKWGNAPIDLCRPIRDPGSDSPGLSEPVEIDE